MATAADNLIAALTNATLRLAELDTVPVSERVRATVTDGDVRLSWNDYRAALVAEVEKLTDLVGKVRVVTQGPFTVATGTVRG